ncbi:hypothetical protein [Marinomonas gallaica]|uniref:hypothetical protein n=1 Tax=Marinomonas gallaica TaxID=1806667 RepID=UPI00082A5041|nr:hypothetical protein [Marinomonas gallaica]
MDTESFFWEISKSPYKSKFLSETLEFGKDNPVFLLDQFSGKQPALINKEFLETGNLKFEMFPTALLDSNVLDQLDKFVQKGKTTDGFLDFLIFITQRGWDSSALFYYLEHYSKSDIDVFKKNAIRRTESLLKIHSMNEPHFLKTGEVIPNIEAVEHYKKSSDARSLYEVAEKRVESFIANYNKSSLTAMLEATEIALIKMVLIRKTEMNRSSIIEQYNEFIRFLKVDLGMILAREAHLAIHYFCDNAGRLLGIQSTTSKEKAAAIIRSTAWDIYLLRMPEIMFPASPSEVCISYVSTQEKQLQALARLFSLERIESFASSNITPIVGFSMEGIPEHIQVEISDHLLPVNETQSISLPIGLKQALYNQLEVFCA